MLAPYWDAIVVGGGFYGCEVALELRRLGYKSVLLLEREADIMRRASFVNQARVHQGYHYPRSLPTAARSRENFAAFCSAYDFAVVRDFTKFYAIARNSKVSSSQFEAFCRRIDIPYRVAPDWARRLFNPSLIDEVYTTQEYAFNATAIADHLRVTLPVAGVVVQCNTNALICPTDGDPEVRIDDGSGQTSTLRANLVFNCTYADIERSFSGLRAPIKKEMTELVLIEPPRELNNVGVTVMDGPFFSTMPFPALNAFSLSHVRYTPHSFSGPGEPPPPAPRVSHAIAMLRDSARYLPCLGRARIIGSLYETKAILMHNEHDDGRPILFERAEANPRIISILGGKIDNIFDVLLALREMVRTS